MRRRRGVVRPRVHLCIALGLMLVVPVLIAALGQWMPARAAALSSADCINCNDTPSGDIQWVGSNTDVGWGYVPNANVDLAEIATNFGAGLGADRTVTSELFQGVPGQAGTVLLGSVSFPSSVAHGQLGGAPFPAPVPLTAGQLYFIGFLNVGGLGVNVDADNDFQGSLSDPDANADSCDGKIPADPSCDPDGAALRILGNPSVGGLHIDTDGSGNFGNVDMDLAPVALAAPIIDLRAPAAAPTPTPPPVSPCVGDCNDDQQVTVDEIVTMVGIALGNGQRSDCRAGDANNDGLITVDEILSAVNNALNGCNAATPTPTPTGMPVSIIDAAASVSGHTTIAIDAATVISAVVAAAANGLQVAATSQARTAALMPADTGGQAAGSCPLGGTATKSGDVVFGETVTLTGCTVATLDGSAIFDGSLSFGLLAQFVADVQVTFKDMTGTTTEVATANISGSGAPMAGGSCSVTGISLTLTGSLTRTLPGGPTVGLTFSGTSVTVDNVVFSTACVPTTFDITLNGDVTLLDPSGAVQSVTFSQFVLHFDSSGTATTVTLNGGMQSTCFGGMVTLTTETPISVPDGLDCPTAGGVTAASASGQATITFEPDGSVMIQSTSEGTLTAPNCFDPRLLMCLA